jgi:hypothetical protein
MLLFSCVRKGFKSLTSTYVSGTVRIVSVLKVHRNIWDRTKEEPDSSIQYANVSRTPNTLNNKQDRLMKLEIMIIFLF